MTNERPARQSLTLFQTVYEWYGVHEREGERIELLVGDGLLHCVPEVGETFRHPILLQKLELKFVICWQFCWHFFDRIFAHPPMSLNTGGQKTQAGIHCCLAGVKLGPVLPRGCGRFWQFMLNGTELQRISIRALSFNGTTGAPY